MWTKWFCILLSLTAVNCNTETVAVWGNNTFAVPDLKTVFCGVDLNTVNVSATCVEQLNAVCSNVNILLTMLDASAKFPYSGINYTSRLEYGVFDQCMTIDYTYVGGRILGEHCTVGLVIPELSGGAIDIDNAYRLGMCRPNGCSASDFNAIASSLLNFPFPFFQDYFCQTKESNSEYTVADIVTLVIYAVFVALMVASTIYEIFLYYGEKKSAHPLLCAFSILSNGKKLLHISKHSTSKEQIETFHGLRVISMMWIVAGHGFVGWQNLAVVNRKVVDTWLDQRYAVYISSGPLAVDTFFYMSGFLLAFQYLKGKSKPLTAQILSIPKMYIHRYLRLTPAMLMVYLAVISLFKHLGSGPIWPFQDSLAQTCKDNWWSFFLYIQNYHNYNNLCLTQTWYLSADMQMFLLSPLVLIPISIFLQKRSGFKISMAEMFGLCIISTFVPMVHKLIFPNYDNEYDTHSRLINYFVGIMLGVFMRNKIDKPFLYKVNEHRRYILNLIIWTVILLGMFTIVMCYQEMEMHGNHASVTVFHSLMRPAWCIGLSWITYSCYHGYGGVVNWILCRPIFQVLGRLTYCIYLLHGTIIIYYVLTVRVRWFFTDYVAFYQFCGHYIVSVIFAIFWTLAFESPLIIVEKYLMGGGGRPSQRKPNVPALEPTSKVHDISNEPTQQLPSDVEIGGVYRKSNEI